MNQTMWWDWLVKHARCPSVWPTMEWLSTLKQVSTSLSRKLALSSWFRAVRRLPARRDLFCEDFHFAFIKIFSSFYLKTITVSIFTDHWGEIKKKPLTLIILKLRLARRSALSTFLREADESSASASSTVVINHAHKLQTFTLWMNKKQNHTNVNMHEYKRKDNLLVGALWEDYWKGHFLRSVAVLGHFHCVLKINAFLFITIDYNILSSTNILSRTKIGMWVGLGIGLKVTNQWQI